MKIEHTELPFLYSRSLKQSFWQGKRLIMLLGLLVLSMIVVFSLTAARSTTSTSTLPTGVSLMGVDLGGLDRQGAERRLTEGASTQLNQSIHFQAGDQIYTATLHELGVQLALDESVKQPFSAGRETDFLTQLGQKLGVIADSHNAQAYPPVFDLSQVEQAPGTIALRHQVEMPVRNATLSLGQNGEVTLSPAQAGRALNLKDTLLRLQDDSAHGLVHDINLTTQAIPPTRLDSDLLPLQHKAQEFFSQPFTLSYGGQSWTLSQADLHSMVSFDNTAADPAKVMRIEATPLSPRLEQLRPWIEQPAHDAHPYFTYNSATFNPDTPASHLDLAGSLAAITSAANAGNHNAELLVQQTPATITTAAVKPVVDRANVILTGPITATTTISGYSASLSTVEIRDLISFQEITGTTGLSWDLAIDEAYLHTWAEGIATALDRPAHNAHFHYDGQNLQVDTVDENGYAVDKEALVATVKTALTGSGDARTIKIPLKEIKAAITADMRTQITFPDRLYEASTPYTNSSPARKHNVERAVTLINGAVVAPDETFSFDNTLGPATLSNGFTTGYGIVLENNKPETVPTVAGGICQVSTTLFQASFWTGLPIVERNYHRYWIDLYGIAPSGMKGLDATVFTPEVDLKFKNTTGHWLAIVGSADGDKVTFTIYGTNPGWKVNVAEPVISKVKVTNRTMIYKADPTLAPGQHILVEHAQDGFDVEVIRTVTDSSGILIDTLDLKSHYEPASNVTVYGPR